MFERSFWQHSLGVVALWAIGCGGHEEDSEPQGIGGGGSSAVEQAAAGTAPVVFEDSQVAPTTDAWPTPCSGVGCGVVVDFAIGDGFGCALRQDGKVLCWIGDPAVDSCLPPTVLDDVGNATQLIAGYSSILVLFEDAAPLELHLAYQAPTLTRKSHSELLGLTGFSLGSGHICGINAAGNVICSGGNAWGQLGTQDYDYAGTQLIPVVERVSEIASDYVDTCALDYEKHITCWGGPSAVLPPQSVMGSTPVRYDGLPGFVHLAVGADRACGATADGQVTCWGSDVTCSTHRALTCDNQQQRRMGWLDGATSIALEDDATCGVKNSEIYCEIDGGLTNCQTLSDGSQRCDVLRSRYLKRAGGLSRVQRFGSGSPGRCALLNDGTLWCYAGNTSAARPINLN